MAKKKKSGPTIGVTITSQAVEAVVFSSKKFELERIAITPLPDGLLADGGDKITDLNGLGACIKETIIKLGVKVPAIHLCVPPTLLRMVEMPRLDMEQLYVSLSSEAERYKMFDGSEAVVDFIEIPGGQGVAPNMQRILFGAMRKDTFDNYRRVFAASKIKLASIDMEPINALRSMAGTGVLDSLLDQIGEDATWGTLFVSMERVHFSLWQGNSLSEFREVQMDTTGFSTADANSTYLLDMMDEIRRTCKNLMPAIWFTHNMPDMMSQILSERLGVPVRPCSINPALPGQVYPDQTTVMPSTVGAAMHHLVDFPFEFDLLSTAGSTAAGKMDSAGGEGGDDPEGGTPLMLIGAGVGTWVLLLSLWGAMMLYDTLALQTQLTDLEKVKKSKLEIVTNLNVQLAEFKKKYALQNEVLEIVENAQLRNLLYLTLTQDLQRVTPSKMWLHNINTDGSIVFEGRAMDHQAVINFARTFDEVPYTGQVQINSLKEGMVGTVPVFDFKITGQVNLNKNLLKLLPQASATKEVH